MSNFFGFCVVAVFALLVGWMFIMFPVTLHADRKCLEAGYPKSSVTYNFDIYCMNLDGSVTVRVDKQ